MAEFDREHWEGVVRQDRLVNSDTEITATTDYTQAGVEPDVPEPASTTQMPLEATGEMPTGDDVTVTIQRAGMPGIGGARFVARDTATASTGTFGWEVPHHIVGQEVPMTWSAAKDDIDPFLAKLSGGELFMIAHRDYIVGNSEVRCAARSTSTEGWISAVQVRDLGAATTYSSHPCLVPLPGDVMAAFYFTENAGGTGIDDYLQINMALSTDSGSTWADAAISVLPAGLSYGGTAGAGMFDPTYSRIRAAYKDGQILLLVQIRTTDTAVDHQSILIQYASVDQGASFTEVTRGSGVYSLANEWGAFAIDLTVWRDQFYIGFVGMKLTGLLIESPIVSIKLSSAFDSYKYPGFTVVNDDEDYGTSTQDGATSAYYISEADLTIVAMGEMLIAYGRRVTADGSHPTFYSTDGSTWRGLTINQSNNGGRWWFAGGPNGIGAGDLGEHPLDFHGIEHRGRVVIGTNLDAGDANAQNKLLSLSLGGWSTMTLPQTMKGASDNELETMSQFEGNWLPTDLPGNYLYINGGGAGSTTNAISNGKQQLITDTTNTSWSASISGLTLSPTLGVILEIDAAAVQGVADAPGTSEMGLRIAFGADSTLGLSIGTDKWVLYDDNTSTQIGSDIPLGGNRGVLRILFVSGEVSTWYMGVGDVGDIERREWTVGPSSSSMDTGAGIPQAISWGHINTATKTNESYWYRVQWSTAELIGDASVASGGQTNPDDLFAAPVLTEGFDVWDGLRVGAKSGPGLKGDNWNIARIYQYGFRNVYFGNEPSRSNGWRSTSDANVTTVTWDRQVASADTSYSEIYAVLLWGINWRTATLRRDIGGAGFATWDTIDSAYLTNGLDFSRFGDVIVPASTSTGVGKSFPRNAFAGGTWKDDSGNVNRILRSDPGRWIHRDNGPAVRLYLDSDGVTGSEDTSGTNGEIWRNYVFWFGALSSSEEIEMGALQLKISNQNTVDNDYRIGGMMAGNFYPYGTHPEWGSGKTKTTNVEIISYDDGRRSVVERGSPRATYRTAWTNSIPQRVLHRNATAPLYGMSLGTGGRPVASLDGTPDNLWGLLDDIQGAAEVVGLVRRWPQPASSGAAEQNLVQLEQCVPVRLMSPVEVQNVSGNDLDCGNLQVAELEWDEEL